jgi:hypothetical protein
MCDPPVPWWLGRIELGHALRSVPGLYHHVSVFNSAAVSTYLDPPLNVDPDPDTATVLNRILLKAEIHYARLI